MNEGNGQGYGRFARDAAQQNYFTTTPKASESMYKGYLPKGFVADYPRSWTASSPTCSSTVRSIKTTAKCLARFVAQDITEQKKAKELIKFAELAMTNRRNEAQSRGSREGKQQSSYPNMSHENRTPMNAITKLQKLLLKQT